MSYPNNVCSKCGGPIKCEYVGDMGAVDHYFTWKHYCQNPNCAHVQEFENFGCSGQAGRGDDEVSLAGNCPGCGNKAKNVSGLI